jgi:hypothetical protein
LWRDEAGYGKQSIKKIVINGAFNAFGKNTKSLILIILGSAVALPQKYPQI